MIMPKIKALTLFLLVSFLAVPVALAQEKLTKTFTSADGTFAFNYPENWQFGVVDQSKVAGGNVLPQQSDSQDAVRLQIYFPTSVVQSRIMGFGDTPVDLVKTLVQFHRGIFEVASALKGEQHTPTPSPDISATQFMVGGRPAARFTYIAKSEQAGAQIAVMVIALDVGGYLVLIIADSPKGFGATLSRYEQTILEIATSVRFVPPTPLRSPNPELPNVFSGQIGSLLSGETVFYYPENWFLVPANVLVFQNTDKKIDQAGPQTGQMQGSVVDPITNMLLFNTLPNVRDCRIDRKAITATSVSEQIVKLGPGTASFTVPASIIVNGKPVVLRRMVDGKHETLLLTVDFGMGNVIALTAYTPLGEMWKYEKQLIAIVGTLQYKPPPCPPTTK